MNTPIEVQIPEPLLISSEKFFLDTTETLDPLVSLTLLSLIKQLIKIAYLMGHQDGMKREVPGYGP